MAAGSTLAAAMRLSAMEPEASTTNTTSAPALRAMRFDLMSTCRTPGQGN